MRNGASDYLLKNNLARLVPAIFHAIEASETRRARERADLELGASKQRLHELAQHLQTSVEMERAAIAREIHDDVGGSLTALKFDLAWIARHSDTTEVVARAAGALETVSFRLEVSDNGRGLSQDDLAKVRSFGIRGLHERARTVGGWVDLSSGPGGTTLILSVPLQEADEAGDTAEPPTPGPDIEDPTGWGDL